MPQCLSIKHHENNRIGPQLNELVKISPQSADNAALAMFVKIGARKRFFIRLLESILRPIVVGLAWFGYPRKDLRAQVHKILVIEYWNLGDIVMLSPFLKSLRIQYPDARIVLLTSPKAEPLIQGQGLVDEVVVARVPWAQHYSHWRKYNPFSLLWSVSVLSV